MKFTRPLILLVIAALLPLTILSAVLAVASLRQSQDALEREALSKVEIASGLVQRELDAQVAAVGALSQSTLFDGEIDRTTLPLYLERIAGLQPNWRAIVVSDVATGERIASAPQSSQVAPLSAYPEARAQALATGRPTVGRVVHRPGVPDAVGIRAPVMRGGKPRYLITALLTTDSLKRLMEGLHLPAEWRGGLVDSTGRIVVRLNAPQEPVGGFATPATLALRAHMPDGVVELTSLEGLSFMSANRLLPTYNWSIHVALPTDLYRAPLRRAIWLIASSGFVCLLLAGLFIWLLGREFGLRQRETLALEEARRMEALGRITGGVAHDFNNLLMIVQGSADMAKRRADDPARVTSAADAILTAAQSGQALTRQLLAFARRSAYEPTDFRLQDRAGGLEPLIRQSLRDGITLRLAIPPELWSIHADPDALAIALINLAANARDAMPEGGALAVSALNVVLRGERGAGVSLKGEFVAVSVRDTGLGIPAEHVDHIFEPFYTTKPVGQGTGLGLSQVYGYARQSGGAVTAASPPGGGALFTLYLPRGGEVSAASQATAAAE